MAGIASIHGPSGASQAAALLRRRRWCVAVVFLFASLALLAAGCGGGKPPAELSVVPELTALTPQEAAAALRGSGLELGEMREVHDEAVPVGHIISTSPPAGEELERGSAVDLVVSRGQEVAAVPALLGSAEADALAALRAGGFLAEVIRAYDESVPAGTVCAMEPAPGTMARRGSTVALTVSLGSAYVTCGTCGGDGKVSASVTCPECGGTGACYT